VNSKLSVRGALLWSFGERYASLIITVASTMILARVLTPAQIGVFSLCAAVVAVAGILRDFGISEYLIQEKDLTRDKMRAAFTLALIIAWTIAIIVFALRNVIADYYAEKGVAEVLAVLSLNFVILPFASPAFALLNREMAFRKIFAAQITSNAIHAATSITLAVLGYSYMSLAWASVASTLMQTVLLGFLRPRESFLQPGLKDAQTVLAYGSMFVTSRVIETFTRNAHEFIIAKQFGFISVGLFSRAFGLIDLFYTNFTSAMLRVTTPLFANDHRGGNDLPSRYASGTSVLTVFAWPFLGYLALMSNEIILVLFGPQWGAAAPVASMLALSAFPNYLVTLGPSLLAATGHVKRRLLLTVWYTPIHLIAILVASNWGLLAMAAAFGITSLAGFTMYAYQLPRIFGCTARQLFGASGKSALVATMSIAAQAAAHMACMTYQINSILTLILVGMAALLAWLLAAHFVSHVAYLEIMRFLQSKWRHNVA